MRLNVMVPIENVIGAHVGGSPCLKRLFQLDQAFGTSAPIYPVAARPRAVEHCELCSACLAQEHPHLVELVSRQILCACDACAMLFDGMEKQGTSASPGVLNF